MKCWLIITAFLPLTLYAGGYIPELPDDSTIITEGRFYYEPGGIKGIRKRIGSTPIYGIYDAGDKIMVAPAPKVRVKRRSAKQQVSRHTPEYIKLRPGYIENTKTGVRFSYAEFKTPGSPRVYLSLPGICEGDHPAIPVRRCDLPINGYLEFEFSGVSYQLIHSARTYEREQPSDINIVLRNSVTGKEQLLSSRDDMISTRSYFVFAGDLDGDGLLDIILDESPKYHQGHLKLYLSTAAADGDMVRLAAEERNSEDPPYHLLMEQ